MTPSLDQLLEQRSRRLRLFVLAVAVGCSLGLLVYAATKFIPPKPYGLADDYRVFYAAARLLAAGRNPYSLPVLQAAEQATAHYGHLQPALDRFAYLPTTGILMEPLAKLPFWASYAIFSLFGLAAAAIVVMLLARDLGWNHSGQLLGAVLVSWVAVVGVASGQFDTILLATVGGAMLLAWHDRSLPAGVVLGLIWIKPELLWPVPIFLALAMWPDTGRVWRFSAGFLLGSAAFLAVSIPLLPAWWSAALAFAHGVGSLQPDLAGLPSLQAAAPKSWGLSAGVLAPGTLLVVGLALVGMAVVAVWMLRSPHWRRVTPMGKVAWGVSLPVGIWLAACPYSHSNDVLLALPLLMLTLGRDARRVHGLGLGPAILVVGWILAIWPASAIPWAIGIAVLAVVAVAAWILRLDPRLTGMGAGLCVLSLALLPAAWPFHLLAVALTPAAVLLLVIEGSRTCWMEVGGAGTGPVYAPELEPGLP